MSKQSQISSQTNLCENTQFKLLVEELTIAMFETSDVLVDLVITEGNPDVLVIALVAIILFSTQGDVVHHPSPVSKQGEMYL
jgi:hypothetical protein